MGPRQGRIRYRTREDGVVVRERFQRDWRDEWRWIEVKRLSGLRFGNRHFPWAMSTRTAMTILGAFIGSRR